MGRTAMPRAEICARLVVGCIFRTGSGRYGKVVARWDDAGGTRLDVDHILVSKRFAVRRMRAVRADHIAKTVAGFTSATEYKRALSDARLRVAGRISSEPDQPIAFEPAYAFGTRRA